MSEKQVCKALNYFKHFLIFISAVTGFISVFPFALLVGVPVGIANSVVGLKIYAITAGIKKYQSIIKKKKEHLIELLIKTKFNIVKVWFIKP